MMNIVRCSGHPYHIAAWLLYLSLILGGVACAQTATEDAADHINDTEGSETLLIDQTTPYSVDSSSNQEPPAGAAESATLTLSGTAFP